jgi:hypothetical protein
MLALRTTRARSSYSPDCSRLDKKDAGEAHASYNIFTAVYFTLFGPTCQVFERLPVVREDPFSVNWLTPGGVAGHRALPASDGGRGYSGPSYP